MDDKVFDIIDARCDHEECYYDYLIVYILTSYCSLNSSINYKIFLFSLHLLSICVLLSIFKLLVLRGAGRGASSAVALDVRVQGAVKWVEK